MICHKYKCIFIHIPRTAGSSIESWIIGDDWWNVDKTTKHLLASQAKSIYSEYWNDYFKFSIVRNPWDRMMSCMHFASHFGLNQEGLIDFSGYKDKFGYPLTIEHDFRFYNREELINDHHIEYGVYQNILDEELDYIGKYEDLPAVISDLRSLIGVTNKFDFGQKIARSSVLKYRQDAYNENNLSVLENIYLKDIEKYGYKYY